MDLVFGHQGRYWELDYKSNRLEDPTEPGRRAVLLHHRYDVQAALYTLALHRLLRQRLPQYDPSLHLGGAVLWFVRALDQPDAGLQPLPLAVADVLALDALLAQGSAHACAMDSPPASAAAQAP